MSQEKPRKNRTGSNRTELNTEKPARNAQAAGQPIKKRKATAHAKALNPDDQLLSLGRSSRSMAQRPAMSDSERNERVSVAAYFRAEKRGFAPGGELDDWFSAETEIK